jgi:sporulation protein YlmC with PRC-barrel domain
MDEDANMQDRTSKKQRQSKLYMGDLLDSKIVTAEGKKLGHVADVQLTPGPEYRVTALLFGEGGWLHRLHVLNPFIDIKSRQKKADSLPWDAVDRIEHGIVTLKSGHEPQVQVDE